MKATTFEVLAILEGGECSAAEVLERLGTVTADVPPPLPTFYRRLKVELDEGRVEIANTLHTGRGGRPQHLYALTDVGREALVREARRLASIAQQVLGADASAGS